MTKQEKKIKRYVNAIERELRLPLKAKARINGDIGTDIHARLEKGQSIDEIIAEMQAELGKETFLFAYDAKVSAHGTEKAPFTGRLTATFKVDEQYNGQKLNVYRYVDGKVEHSTVKVKDGEATLKLDSFGPILFATHGGMSLWLVFLIVILVIVGVLVIGFAALCIRAQIIRRRKRLRRKQRQQ